MENPVLDIFMRYLHVVSAVLAVGGLCFMPICVAPAVRLLDDGLGESVLKIVRSRFHRLLWICIAGLVVSGVYNWVGLAQVYKDMGPKGNALIGTKVLLALIMFVVAGLGTGGVIKPKAAGMINIHLAAVVILLAAVLRYYRLG